MADFVRYPKIENLRRMETDYPEFGSKMVCVLEKVHGSNGSYNIKPDGSYSVGKRTSYLVEGDKFCNGFRIGEKYKTEMMGVVSELTQSPEDSVRFYGEFYGGLYNKTTRSGATKVQTKVDYCPDNAFVVFDIVSNVSDMKCVLPWDRVKELCQKYGLPHVPELYRGKWADLKKTLDVETLTSKVPLELHGLSDVSDPACEGVIIRHDSDDNDGWGLRCKWKQTWMDDLPREKQTKTYYPDPKIDESLAYMNEARFVSYKSKVGDEYLLTKSNMPKNMLGLVDDAIEDIKVYVKGVDEELIGNLRKHLSKKARGYIIDYWNGKEF
jgi:Rnl2 family RNA ligase